MFAAAVDLEAMRSNPVDRVKPPKVKRSPRDVVVRNGVTRVVEPILDARPAPPR
jgi:hypothetical protein